MKTNTRSWKLDYGLLIAGILALFAIEPLLHSGLPSTADTPIHFYRTLEFSHSWAWGVYYPRWAPNLAYGYGYPLWSFAPPLPYVIPTVIHMMGFALEMSFKLFIISSVFLYPVGAYLFVKNHLGKHAGLIAATIYTFAPFALRELHLYGGNYPQYMAIGLFPWVLWALARIQHKQKTTNIVIASFIYGSVILSHLFHALILSPVAGLYVCLLWFNHIKTPFQKRKELKRFIQLVLPLALGIAWTSCFWLPAFIERQYTRAVEDIYISVSPFYLRFLNWTELLALPQVIDSRAINPWVPFSLGIVTIILAGIGFIAMLIPSSRSPSRSPSQYAIFFSIVLGITIFLVMPVSEPIWTNVPLLAVAEFPWRVLGLANLSLAFLGGGSVYIMKGVRKYDNICDSFFMFIAILLILITSMVYLYPFQPFVHYGNTIADMTRYEKQTQTIGTTTLGEYLPKWVEEIPESSPIADAHLKSNQTEKFDRTTMPNNATAQQLESTPIRDRYLFTTETGFHARFLTFYFLGWHAYQDGEQIDIDIEDNTGLITVFVPSGRHEIELRFEDTPLRATANWISLLTVLMMGVLLLRGTDHNLQTLLLREEGESEYWQGVGFPIVEMGGKQLLPDKKMLFIAITLISLLLLKRYGIEPYTTWFRHQSSPNAVTHAQYSQRINMADQFWLLGYDLPTEKVQQGNTLKVVLYWQAQQKTDINYRSFVHLNAPLNRQTWAINDNFHPGDSTAQIEIPTTTWDTNHYVRDEHFVFIPPEMPPIHFDMLVGLYNPHTQKRVGQDIILRQIEILPNRRHAHTPANPTYYRFGDSIKLIGWDMTENNIMLYWQIQVKLTEDYVIFVHLIDEKGELLWGHDAPPISDIYPTTAWHTHLTITDPHPHPPHDLMTESTHIAIGIYHPQTFIRLDVIDSHGESMPNNQVMLRNEDN
ncbi:MAG: hypothetical protein B6242_13305 [Anaerolineaceae bacterium 4572_78]|nr:MAG: hypothetical protein B6242_13305 [Anaerolineaceae bacterium 4572_78]